MSSQHYDAEFINDLKLSGGIDIFGGLEEREQRNVTYSFECEALKSKL